MRRHLKSLIKSPGLNNAAIGEVFVGLVNDVFKNYHSFQTSGDITAYINPDFSRVRKKALD
ncbi:hypothetical protein [Fischerella sp. PCC 9605]|uniref:hypothetical protein n=1 Tax=Fischerella sp. PCC 9605 TaxID=1173024 RepID=UPI0012DF290F|nr:hypothetical protein [Fischerella sp. PCC 9605]